MPLYSSQVICPCFHLLYASFLYLNSVTSALFTYAGLLLPLLLGMDYS